MLLRKNNLFADLLIEVSPLPTFFPFLGSLWAFIHAVPTSQMNFHSFPWFFLEAFTDLAYGSLSLLFPQSLYVDIITFPLLWSNLVDGLPVHILQLLEGYLFAESQGLWWSLSFCIPTIHIHYLLRDWLNELHDYSNLSTLFLNLKDTQKLPLSSFSNTRKCIGM